jgi:hypothetical protein
MAGDFVAARDHLEKALAISDPERDRDLAFRYGTDLETSALSFSLLVQWPLGEWKLARERADRLAARIMREDQAASTYYGLVFLALYEMLGRRIAGAESVTKPLTRHADKYEMESWRGLTLSMSSWEDWQTDHRTESLSQMRLGLEHERERGAIAWSDRTTRRRPRYPRARARRLCAHAGNAGDRRGAGTVGRGCSIVPREEASARGQLPLCVCVFRVEKIGRPPWAEFC